MSKKRSNIEIFAKILRVAAHGARKSHIVYKANLNFQIVKTYLATLMSAGLLNGPQKGSKLYTTTNKGREFINYYEGFQQFTTSL